MATTSAARRTRSTITSTRSAERRDAHSVAPTAARERQTVAASASAMHITPNVLIAARGAVRSRGDRAPVRTLRSSALDLRRLRS